MNTNVENIEISGIRKFSNKVSQVEGALSLTLGQPDFKTPGFIKKAMIDSIENDKTTYTSNAGIVELRQEISNYLKTFNINFSTEDVCITVGGSEGLYAAFQGVLNPGDVILVPDPSYPAYKAIGTIIGANVIEYKLNKEFLIDIEDLKGKIKKFNPKAMVLSYPSNPTGAVMTKELRDNLYKILKDEKLYIITDEIYASVCYEDNYYSVCQYEDLVERCIYISGFSKMFSLTGLRIGYICCKNKLLNEIMKVHQYNVSCAPSVAQYGALKGLTHCLNDVEIMKEEFKKRRDFVYSRLKEIGFQVNMPKGAFYIFPKIPKENISSNDFCVDLLNKEKVACVPGSAFGTSGEGFMRISYCYSMEELKKALNHIEDYLRKN